MCLNSAEYLVRLVRCRVHSVRASRRAADRTGAMAVAVDAVRAVTPPGAGEVHTGPEPHREAVGTRAR
jgi:hypothetical protein